MAVRDRARAGVMVVLVLGACGGDDVPPGVVRKAIGPDGGLISTEDDVLTIVIQPGALGEWIDVEIERSDAPPPSFAPAYRVQPNVALAVYSEVIYRHELPDDPSSAAIGAIHIADFESGAGDWTPLPREPGGLIVSEKTLHARDNELALYYALLGEGGVAETTMTDSMTTTTVDPETSAGEESDSDSGEPVSFATDVQPILTARCTEGPCHDADAPANVLDLTDSAYDRIVDAIAAAGRTLAIPGNADG
ncbi:MAG: hypothetical protein IAG13_08220, partial [Deltaproteobacteria bacterium]|nr:hypothetical protein [Nannocystaceae bacterium]